MHGQNINLPVCVCVCLSVCVCVCVSVTLSVNSPTGQTPQRIFTVDSLKDADLRKDAPFGVSMMNNHFLGSKVPQNPHIGGLNRHFKPNMRKSQTAISSHLCIRLTWNLTRTSWVVSYGGKRISRWRTAAILKFDISPYLSEKSSDFHDVIKKWKSCIGQTPECDRTYFLF